MKAANRCPDAETLSMHALGLLEEGESVGVQLHLAACSRCRAEVDSLSQTLAHLALQARSAEPPPGLKARTMEAIDRADSAGRPSTRPGGSIPMRLWIASLATVAAVAAALVFGLQAFRGPGDGVSPAIAQAVSQAKRQGAQVSILEGTKDAPTARGELYVVSTSAGAMRQVVISVEGLARPAGSQVYCLWLIKDGKRSVGGWITVDRNGRGGLVFETPIAFESVGVTLEPDPEYYTGEEQQLVPRGPKVLGLPRT